MTPDQRSALIALVEMDGDRAFQLEWLDRGGHYQVCHGIPEKQDALRKALPLSFVITTQVQREDQRA